MLIIPTTIEKLEAKPVWKSLEILNEVENNTMYQELQWNQNPFAILTDKSKISYLLEINKGLNDIKKSDKF